MTKLLKLISLPTLVLSSSIAIANPATEIIPLPYAGLSLSFASFTEEITGAADYETGHFLFSGRAGLKFNDYFSGEFRLGKGDEDITT
jgi:hypothetical protein